MSSKLSPQGIPKRTYGICDIHHIGYPHSYPQAAREKCDEQHTDHVRFVRVYSCICGQGMLLFSYKKLTQCQ
jgi:hypothetical protein